MIDWRLTMRKLTNNEVVQISGGVPYLAKTVGLIGACIGAVWVMPFALVMAGFSGDSPGVDSDFLMLAFLGIESLGTVLGCAVGYGLGTMGDWMVM